MITHGCVGMECQCVLQPSHASVQPGLTKGPFKCATAIIDKVSRREWARYIATVLLSARWNHPLQEVTTEYTSAKQRRACAAYAKA